MPLTEDFKETIADRAATDPAFVAALREEMARLNCNERKRAHDLLETALIRARRHSATQGNTIDVNASDL